VDPNGVAGDGPYGRPLDGSDLPLILGRLPVDDAAELAHLVQKTVAFETDPMQWDNVENVAWTSHQFDADGVVDGMDYAIWQENFGQTLTKAGFHVTQIVGATADDPMPELLATATEGQVLSVYNGFGSAHGWPKWTAQGESLTPEHVLALDNETTPVHFAFAPRTAALDEDDSLAEAWLASLGGAVSVFGATSSTQSYLTFKLERCFVKSWSTSGDTAVPVGLLICAVQAAEEAPDAEDDRWVLAGDPALTVPVGDSAATDDVFIDGKIITAENYDAALVVGPEGGSLTVEVRDPDGKPVDDVLVSLVIGKSSIGPSGELLAPAFQHDAYTEDGVATIVFTGLEAPSPPAKAYTAGLNLVFADGSVRFLSDSIPVQFGDAKDLGGGVAGSLAVAPQLASTDTLEPGELFVLEVDEAPADSLGALFLSSGTAPFPVPGGTFHAAPIAQSWIFATNAQGPSVLPLGPAPDPLQTGLELVFQAVVVDAGAPLGFALTNGLLVAN
jgi:hypothetical protein